jgi:hypothetical protein
METFWRTLDMTSSLQVWEFLDTVSKICAN